MDLYPTLVDFIKPGVTLPDALGRKLRPNSPEYSDWQVSLAPGTDLCSELGF